MIFMFFNNAGQIGPKNNFIIISRVNRGSDLLFISWKGILCWYSSGSPTKLLYKGSLRTKAQDLADSQKNFSLKKERISTQTCLILFHIDYQTSGERWLIESVPLVCPEFIQTRLTPSSLTWPTPLFLGFIRLKIQ